MQNTELQNSVSDITQSRSLCDSHARTVQGCSHTWAHRREHKHVGTHSLTHTPTHSHMHPLHSWIMVLTMMVMKGGEKPLQGESLSIEEGTFL